MTSWAVLLVTSVLLVAPGLAFSGLTPECHDQETAHLWDGDKLLQGLAPEDPQGDQREELNQFCGPCQKIMQMLKYMVGNRPSKVCSKMGLWSILCNQMMKKYLNRISKDIMARKTPQAICVDIKLCKRKAGLI
ncbi:antimicrobial peptide NK-lysin-like isoform X1 [Bos taurus]|uniref:antimicrobial peptide NK-lysin-like isoform X1 n=1 Tax=Bos taurus TaxID=9913 RepID=UPI000572C6F1|nr:antimicrobial peptide NK-lysin-like isoform X1 [Bos taurus]